MEVVKIFVTLSFCHFVDLVTFSRPLIGYMQECCINEESIEVDEIKHINAEAGKKKQIRKYSTELCHTQNLLC